MTMNSCPHCGQPVCSDCGQHHSGQVGAAQSSNQALLINASPAVTWDSIVPGKNHSYIDSFDIFAAIQAPNSPMEGMSRLVTKTWGFNQQAVAQQWIRSTWKTPADLQRSGLDAGMVAVLFGAWFIGWNPTSPGTNPFACANKHGYRWNPFTRSCELLPVQNMASSQFAPSFRNR